MEDRPSEAIDLLAVIVVLLLTVLGMAWARPAHGATPGPAWHCHPSGGSCVAVEPGMKAPYPRAARARAYGYRVVSSAGTTYEAFTTAEACEAGHLAPRLRGVTVTSCRSWTAAQALKVMR
jgi:hypothetical protein